MGESYTTVYPNLLCDSPFSCNTRTTKQPYSQYASWESKAKESGLDITEACKTRVKQFFCMKVFPPCTSKEYYAQYPCDDYCDDLQRLCGDASPQKLKGLCTTTGEWPGGWNSVKGTCFHSDLTFSKPQCLKSEFNCLNGGQYHPECVQVGCTLYYIFVSPFCVVVLKVETFWREM